MSLNAENDAERKKFSLYRGCKTHNWMHIDYCNADKPTQCPKCEIERLRKSLEQLRVLFEGAYVFGERISDGHRDLFDGIAKGALEF